MNQWPDPKELPFFRETMVAYMAAIEDLAKNLLPIYATALNLPPNWFDEAFSERQYVLRCSHYPPMNLAQVSSGLPHIRTQAFSLCCPNQAYQACPY